MLQQGRTLRLSASLSRPRAQPPQEPQDTGMATSGNAGNVPGEVEEVTLFFELSTLLIYHTSILHHNTLITPTGPLLISRKRNRQAVAKLAASGNQNEVKTISKKGYRGHSSIKLGLVMIIIYINVVICYGSGPNPSKNCHPALACRHHHQQDARR